jgi:hypothetical protein
VPKSSLHPGSPQTLPLSLGSAVCSTAGPNSKPGLRVDNDARTGMPFGIPKGAMCVQRFDDSRNSAIRITYRISLRSSSMPEPRDPLLKVLIIMVIVRRHTWKNLWGPLAGAGQGRESPAVRLKTGPPKQHGRIDKGWRWGPEDPNSIMILPQVHLRNASQPQPPTVETDYILIPGRIWDRHHLICEPGNLAAGPLSR